MTTDRWLRAGAPFTVLLFLAAAGCGSRPAVPQTAPLSVRFGVGAAVGLGLAAATRLTPWPLAGAAHDALLIESFVPTAVTMVAVCNMFHLRPREASVLFIANTMMYLVLVLPLVVWLLG